MTRYSSRPQQSLSAGAHLRSAHLVKSRCRRVRLIAYLDFNTLNALAILQLHIPFDRCASAVLGQTDIVMLVRQPQHNTTCARVLDEVSLRTVDMQAVCKTLLRVLGLEVVGGQASGRHPPVVGVSSTRRVCKRFPFLRVHLDELSSLEGVRVRVLFMCTPVSVDEKNCDRGKLGKGQSAL